jgi:opine dehydrogenase
MTTPVAVIGAGPAGLAMAGHLYLRGLPVHLGCQETDPIEAVVAQRAVTLHGVLNGTAPLARVSTDMAEVLEGVEVIFFVVPANAHRSVAEKCGPHLRDGQLILLCPGRTLGALELLSVLQARDIRARVTIAESHTIPHTCRKRDNGSVHVLAMKSKVKIAACPARETPSVMERISRLLPLFHAAQDTLETGMNNIGAIFHPAPMLLNLGWIETRRTQFKHYYEGITPTVARLLESLDNERTAVGKALGARVVSARDWLRDAYGSPGESFYEALQNTACYSTVDAPTSLRHRYLYEDVPTGLVPIASLGEHLHIATPLSNLFIDLAGEVCGLDFRTEGRTVESLGLAGKGVTGIQAILQG